MSQLFFSRTPAEAKRLSRLSLNGELYRLRQGVYTDAPFDKVKDLLLEKWGEVVAHFYPEAIVSHRTARELKPIDGHVFITANVKKRAKLAITPALQVVITPGDTETAQYRFNTLLRCSNTARMLLENLVQTRSTAKVSKALGKEWVEERLCQELSLINGEERINALRDEARAIAPKVGLKKEFEVFNRIIGAILATQEAKGALSSPIALATAKGEPYDKARAERFEALARYLDQCNLTALPATQETAAWRNLSFFESYFSNYIEGTEFSVEEAEQIVFERKEIQNRHADSHDVIAVYQIASDYQEMLNVPKTADDLIGTLQRLHQQIMFERPDKRPGEFKEKVNQAGSSTFVLPEHTHGTLTQGFEIYQKLPDGLPRAIFMQFLVSECHPFDDGNGRLSRLLMNAELYSAGQHKLIVPIVHRESYLNGLRNATRYDDFRTLCKVFYQLQHYTASLPWHDYGEVKELLEQHMAFKLPDEGVATFNREIAKFRFEPPTGAISAKLQKL